MDPWQIRYAIEEAMDDDDAAFLDDLEPDLKSALTSLLGDGLAKELDDDNGLDRIITELNKPGYNP